ncbi:hypothetical protein SISNIDRAFT_449566 [Sistotremastrum niveocremeum HHB9708]|uniref:RING-type domain-containing protein n=1 Tax=Sistotremastrum niveocremeum HHB9708 TaxID=1314777 RepID=A0A164ZQC3_9AGAM|nr:hypothetical protein SISNIDRAFT_449566 [Sistotremastrum niveocremeum HHB9708]
MTTAQHYTRSKEHQILVKVDGEETAVPVADGKGKVVMAGARTSVKVIWQANGLVKLKLGGDRSMIRAEWIDGSSDEDEVEEDDDDAGSATDDLTAQASRLSINEPSSSASNCPLCLGPFREMSTPRCGHAFCRACILSALDNKLECPVCRQAAAPRHLRRIFLGS